MSTDTMMIVHVPADGTKATLISLPRDSYVHIKGHGMDRLNSAYVYGYNDAGNVSTDQRRSAGANLLISTITDLTGLTINHYIQVSLLGFYEISDAIGGVPVTLCHAVDDTHAANQAAGLSGGSGLKLSKGRHVIKGVTALEFVRQRHFLPRGDLDRVRRQQYFLTAAFRQVASVGDPDQAARPGQCHQAQHRLRPRPAPARPRDADGEVEREQHQRQDDPDLAARPSTATTCWPCRRPRSAGSSTTSSIRRRPRRRRARRAARGPVGTDRGRQDRPVPAKTDEGDRLRSASTDAGATVRRAARHRRVAAVRHLLRRGIRRAVGAVGEVAGELGGEDASPAHRRARPRCG